MGDGAVIDDGLPTAFQIAPGGEIHERVGTIALSPAQLLDFLVGVAGNR